MHDGLAMATFASVPNVSFRPLREKGHREEIQSLAPTLLCQGVWRSDGNLSRQRHSNSTPAC